jgi:tRNA (cytidine/uridine-2'-O-)-methyltransferase
LGFPSADEREREAGPIRDRSRGLIPVERNWPSLSMLPHRFHVVLHQPEIAANVGAIGRTCVASGAKLWLIRPLGFQISDKQVRRAGLDYWAHLDWEAVDDWNALGQQLPAAHRRPWFLTKTAATNYCEVRFEPGDVFVFGCETQGLPRSLLDAAPDRCLRIPIRPEVRSLNISVSVGIVVYEALRQISQGDAPPLP